MIVIDTSVLIDALHRKEAALRKIRVLEEMGETLCTTQINVLELYKGVYSPTKSEAGLENVKMLLDAFVILSINEDAYEMFGELSVELRRRGEAIGDFDELIASIALANGAAIVSGDRHFRRVPGLKAVSP
ncbi:MAG: type II toxin-antitoxin system VapC family toxin [Methanothrix sp.]|nr:type II toxin-antitoxin system VapC family toxin [Methanothrix sp.]